MRRRRMASSRKLPEIYEIYQLKPTECVPKTGNLTRVKEKTNVLVDHPSFTNITISHENVGKIGYLLSLVFKYGQNFYIIIRQNFTQLPL